MVSACTNMPAMRAITRCLAFSRARGGTRSAGSRRWPETQNRATSPARPVRSQGQRGTRMNADHPFAAWQDYFVMLGSTAGALVGLLFVVMSLHIASITERSDANMRATIDGSRNNTFHLLTVLAEAAIILAPQPVLWLGVELIIINLYGLR